ncbi:MAG: hypothetical protein FWD68_19755 [Alphaproteobacteria bacterium]|nr:hypothetical protein [Alphaproteobacteria bacterium]
MLQALEAHLGSSPLPLLLRYPNELGVTKLAEGLCEVDGKGSRIEPLVEACPGINARATTAEEVEQARALMGAIKTLGDLRRPFSSPSTVTSRH